MKLTVKQLLVIAHKAFENRSSVLSLWQDIADNFYPARADFLHTRSLGEEFADHLLDSYPVIAHRDLSDAIGTMLRGQEWFEVIVDGEVDHAGRVWLDHATNIQRQKMAFRGSGFKKATKEGDRDFTAFGQTVIKVMWDMQNYGLLYETKHLRNCAWREDASGEVCTVFVKEKLTINKMYQKFGDKIHPQLLEKYNNKEDCEQEIDCMHLQVPVREYTDEPMAREYMSFYIDVTNEHMMEEVNVSQKMYVVPRFATIAGCPYGYSPAVMAALPDARAMQAMTHTLMEAGERAANPPMVAARKALREDLNVLANGVTWVDESYDGRLDDVLRPLIHDKSGLPTAFGMKEDVRNSIDLAFYLRSMTLPTDEQMTAYEVSERMKEFVRKTAPLFDPIEDEYNAALCEITFGNLFEYGQLGRPEQVPGSIRGRDIMFKFQSPIKEAEERGLAQKFSIAVDLAAQAAQLQPNVVANFDVDKGYRDSIAGSGVPQEWIRVEDQVAETKKAMAEQAAQAQALEILEKTKGIENAPA